MASHTAVAQAEVTFLTQSK